LAPPGGAGAASWPLVATGGGGYSDRTVSRQGDSTERNVNLWAPWRMEYIHELTEGDGECFLCRYRDEPGRDAENLLLWRRRHTMVVMNRFPYTGGHLMIAPAAHISRLDELDAGAMLELVTSLRDCQALLESVLNADGFNVGLNIGRCAGAGLPGHLHVHIVPRWEGDTNFMTVLGDVRVIPQALEALYAQLRERAAEMALLEG